MVELVEVSEVFGDGTKKPYYTKESVEALARELILELFNRNRPMSDNVQIVHRKLVEVNEGRVAGGSHG